MPRGVIIAITPSLKNLEEDEEVQTDTTATSLEGEAGGAEEGIDNIICYGTVKIKEPGHQHDGKIVQFAIYKGSGAVTSCCNRQSGHEVIVNNIRSGKGGLHADITNC